MSLIIHSPWDGRCRKDLPEILYLMSEWIELSLWTDNWSAHALSFTSDTSNSGAYRTSTPDSGPDFEIVHICIIIAASRGGMKKLQRVRTEVHLTS